MLPPPYLIFKLLITLASFRCVKSAISSTASNCGGFIGARVKKGTVRVSLDDEITTSAVALGSDSDRGGVLIQPAKNPSEVSGIHTRLQCQLTLHSRQGRLANLFSLNSAWAAAVVAASFVDRRSSFSGSILGDVLEVLHLDERV
jgi:hypothetical protein